MANIVVGVFDEFANAEAARDELIQAGLGQEHVRITQRDRPPRNEDPEQSAGFWDNIRDYFGIEEDPDEADASDAAPEARLLGGAVLTVIAQQHTLETILSIMQSHEPESLDEQPRIADEGVPAPPRDVPASPQPE